MCTAPNPGNNFELYKLEYEQAVQRYENIYKDIWQIFSYMAVLTGVILTFGSSQLPLVAAIIIGPIPLVFWYLAIFIPMDRYGQLVKDRLKEIESSINNDFLASSQYKFNHYIEFTKSSSGSGARVSCRVKKFAIIFIFLWILWFISTIININSNNTLGMKSKETTIRLESPVQIQTKDPQILELKTELALLSRKIDSITDILREKTADIQNQKNNIKK